MKAGVMFGRGLFSFWICMGIEGKQDTLLSVELRSHFERLSNQHIRGVYCL